MFCSLNSGHADENRWELLMTLSNGTQFFYDKQLFNSDREGAGTWIRNADKEGGYALHSVRVECAGTVTFHNQRIYASDGRLLKSADAGPVIYVSEPGSGQEKLRDALCAKRPAWQRIQVGSISAQRERWAYLMTSSNGTKIEYDMQTYNSDRESAGSWIQSEINFPRPGTRALSAYRVECNAAVVYSANSRRFLSDGTLDFRSDEVQKIVITPGSYEEKLRDALCAKRPAWQRILSK